MSLNRTQANPKSLDESESKPTLNIVTGDVITQSGRPTLIQVREWFDNATYITLSVKQYNLKKNFQVTDIIKKVDVFGDDSDPLIWLNTLRYGIYAREITAYTYPIKRNLILNDEHKLDATDVITIKANDYQIQVNKHVLSDRSEYFKNMLKHRMLETAEQTIDLTHFFTKNMLQVLFKFLDKRYQAIHSSRMLIHSYYSDTLNKIARTFSDSLDLLASALVIGDKEIVECALKIICDQINDCQLDQAIRQPDKIHPIILGWFKLIMKCKDKYLLNDLDFLTDSFHVSFSYRHSLQSVSQHLATLTGISWSFDEIYLKSNRCYHHHPDEPEHVEIFAYKVVEVLASRQILKIKDAPDTKNRYAWCCKVLDESSLLNLNPIALKKEIIEASALISEITGYPCRYLHLRPVPDGEAFTILKEVGCIDVKEFYAFDVPIINYDIDKLRSLKMQKLNLDEIRNRNEQGTLTFKLPDNIDKEQKQSVSLSSSPHTLLPSRRSVVQEVSEVSSNVFQKKTR